LRLRFFLFLHTYFLVECGNGIDRCHLLICGPSGNREWQFPCRNGECIARYDACDGICSDGSDEWNCDQWRYCFSAVFNVKPVFYLSHYG
ncbi:unnamed protein product, partial [Haemonchus placei]|uniref:LNR domain-containing protein n=1 Tax=Haemonchus placei TaxID=6290 RepID=A0A0N4WJL7_HAEPC